MSGLSSEAISKAISEIMDNPLFKLVNQQKNSETNNTFASVLKEPNPPENRVRTENQVFTSKFKSNSQNGKFDSKFLNYFALSNEIQKHKKNLSIKTAFIDQDSQLIIKTECASTDKKIKENWPPQAFVSGIDLIIKPTKLYVAISNVDTSIDVTNDDFKNFMLNNYNITSMVRIIKKKNKFLFVLLKL